MNFQPVVILLDAFPAYSYLLLLNAG